ncbi:arylamine N-acetyltransferase [Streptomyces sp. NPDC049585]|uniref:arylamine N-acetyltransferase family protein n=1 Tax=Streptomyces sp. NPDC049585 TaxID=3155154 RepID=UPI00344AEBE1
MQTTDTDAYLERIGARRPVAPTLGALRELHLRHVITVPFENLSIHLGEEIALEGAALVDKVVRRARGGFCYELNGAFAELLTALGYRVSLLAGRVSGPEGRLGIPFDHMALQVDIEGNEKEGEEGAGESFLVDVGFGRNSQVPLRLDERGEQADPSGVFRIVETQEGDLDVIRNGEVQYRLERRPRELADFEGGSWWHRTSPQSLFTRSVLCSRPTGSGGRITLAGRTLITSGPGGREERTLTDQEVLPAYREHFGIELERIPQVRPLA